MTHNNLPHKFLSKKQKTFPHTCISKCVLSILTAFSLSTSYSARILDGTATGGTLRITTAGTYSGIFANAPSTITQDTYTGKLTILNSLNMDGTHVPIITLSLDQLRTSFSSLAIRDTNFMMKPSSENSFIRINGSSKVQGIYVNLNQPRDALISLTVENTNFEIDHTTFENVSDIVAIDFPQNSSINKVYVNNNHVKINSIEVPLHQQSNYWYGIRADSFLKKDILSFEGNSVELSNSTLPVMYSGYLVRPRGGSLFAKGNIFQLDNMNVRTGLHGIWTMDHNAQKVEVLDNTVILNNSTIHDPLSFNTSAVSLAKNNTTTAQIIARNNIFKIQNSKILKERTNNISVIGINVRNYRIQSMHLSGNGIEIRNTNDPIQYNLIYGTYGKIFDGEYQGNILIDNSFIKIDNAIVTNSIFVAYAASRQGNSSILQSRLDLMDVRINATDNIALGNRIFATKGGTGTIDGTKIQLLGNTKLQSTQPIFIESIIGSSSQPTPLASILNLSMTVADKAVVQGTVALTYFQDVENVQLENNQLIVKDQADISAVDIYGVTDNTILLNKGSISLVIDNWVGNPVSTTKVRSIQNFSDITFKNLVWQKDGSALIITNGKENSLANTFINIDGNVIVQNDVPQKDESMYLIQITNNVDLGLTERNITQKEVNFEHEDGLIQGNANIALNEMGEVLLTVSSTQPTEQTGLLNDQRVIASALLSRTNDMIPYALDAVKTESQKGIQTFALWENVALRFDVAESVKLNHWAALFGFGHTSQNQYGQWTDAFFFEMGDGNYRTHQMKNNQIIRGDGTIRYYGLGYAFEQAMPNHWYVEAGVRAGYLYTEMENALVNVQGQSLRLKTSAPYLASDVGIGYLKGYDWGNLDFYGKLLYSFNAEDQSSIHQTNIEARSIHSLRSQLGLRIKSNLNEQWSTYMGLAWEYEYMGQSQMRISGVRVPRESLEGSTYIGEYGLRWTSTRQPMTIDWRARGFVGQQKCVSGFIRATYSF